MNVIELHIAVQAQMLSDGAVERSGNENGVYGTTDTLKGSVLCLGRLFSNQQISSQHKFLSQLMSINNYLPIAHFRSISEHANPP